jgi:hypothetical protein
MAEQQLSIRSTRARNLAHMLAKKEQRTVSQIVERALDAYVKPDALKQVVKPEEFWFALIRDNHVEGDADIDLEQIIRESREPHRPVEF